MQNKPIPPLPNNVSPPLKFAYPFRRKDGKEFIDEHEFHALLAKESTGFFPVGASGTWHGGIHISATGAGAFLSLNQGVRCIATGEVVAYRADRTCPVSEMPAQPGKPAVRAPFSTGFALVRHTMEYPAGKRLTFFSLYMHLQGFEDYQKQPSLPKPPYWAKAYIVTEAAEDRPKTHAHATRAPAEQVGLNVRSAPKNGDVLGILSRGSRVRVGETQGEWGRIAELEPGGGFHPIQVRGYVDPRAITGWIYLGKQHRHQVMKEVLSDSQFDQTVVLPTPFPINAGDLIGHLGPYDALSNATTGNRMVHIEVLCDDQIKSYVEQSREYVKKHVEFENYRILRIDRQVKLYKAMGHEGANPPQTGVVQIYPVAALAAGPQEDQAQESAIAYDGKKAHWWKINSADSRHTPITGWVREYNFPGGRVTLETPYEWVDFEMHQGDHDPMHTMFATPKEHLDYWLDANEPDVPSLAKLNPLAAQIYRSVFTKGDGSQAADELRNAWRDPWHQLRLSRLIIKHESEWANPGKWRQLVDWIEQRTAHDPTHDEELKRIAKLVWWDEVAGKIDGFPSSSEVFHIHPIGLVGNFAVPIGKITVPMLQTIFTLAPAAQLQIIVDELNPRLKDYKLESRLRLSHFFAQIREEAGTNLNTTENLNYRASVLMQKFEYFRLHPDEAELYGRTATHPALPEPIANRAYAHKIGNGSVESGDGWMYRGRGLKQLTGRANYQGFQKFYASLWGDDPVDFVANPDRVSELTYAIRSAIFFWISNGLAELANEGFGDEVVDKITAVINRHTDSYDARKNNFHSIWNANLFQEVER